MSTHHVTPALGYLCFAWGESDHPVCAYVMTPAEVGQFFCDQWFGEQPETMHEDNRQQYDDAMEMVNAERDDPNSWDGTDIIEFTFEIGGIRITRCWDVSPAKATGSASHG